MGKCENNIKIGSLSWCDGEISQSGIRRKVYFVPKNDIVKFPKLPNEMQEGDSMSVLSTYEGDFVLEVGKYWQSIDILQDKSPTVSEVQGEKPSKTYNNKMTLIIPNTDAEASGLSRVVANSDIVYIIQQRNGIYRVIGNEMYSTETNMSLNLGSSPTGTDTGTTLEAMCTDVCQLPIYKGEIVTKEGTINEKEP